MFLKHSGRNWAKSRLQFLSASFYVPERPFNEGAIGLAKKMHLRNRSKHIGLRFCFVQHLIAAGIIEPVHVASGNQHADLGTKALADQPFNYHVPYLYGEVLPKS